jgi:IS1 family transposase
MTMVSRELRQIVRVDAAFDKSPERIQAIVDSAPWVAVYFSDGWSGYKDVVYPGKYTQNFHNKKDTFTVEGVNADLRCCIPILARRSRCFARKLEMLYAVVALFAEAYNAFGEAKYRWRASHECGELPFGLVDFL